MNRNWSMTIQMVKLTSHINQYFVSQQMWRNLKVWIPRGKKAKNTEKYHISHTGGEDIERGKRFMYI